MGVNMNDKNVLFLSKECNIICDSIRDKLLEKKFNVEYVDFTGIYEPHNDVGLYWRLKIFFNLIAEFMKRSMNYAFIICSPIDSWLLSLLFSLIFAKPEKIVIIIPPSPKHIVGFAEILKIHLFRFFMTLFSLIDAKTLLILTTPYEVKYLEMILRSHNYVFVPPYESSAAKVKELIHSEKPLIVIPYNDWMHDRSFYNALETFRELGITARYVIVASDYKDQRCISDYRVICISSDDYSDIISQSTIVVIRRADPEANKILIDAIMNGRPVISSREVGMAHVYRDTGLVVFEDLWTPDTFSNIVLKILNEIDQYKKASLKSIPITLKSDYGISILTSFLEE